MNICCVAGFSMEEGNENGEWIFTGTSHQADDNGFGTSLGK